MAKVNICNVVVKDNPCPFRHPFQFEITFECIENLNEGGVSQSTYINLFIFVVLFIYWCGHAKHCCRSGPVHIKWYQPHPGVRHSRGRALGLELGLRLGLGGPREWRTGIYKMPNGAQWHNKAKAKQRCVMGVGMCLYAQLVQTKNT